MPSEREKDFGSAMIEEASREQHQREEEEEERKKTNEAPSSSGPEKKNRRKTRKTTPPRRGDEELSLNVDRVVRPNVFEKDDSIQTSTSMRYSVRPRKFATEVEKYADELQNKLVEMVNRIIKICGADDGFMDVDKYVKLKNLEVLKGLSTKRRGRGEEN